MIDVLEIPLIAHNADLDTTFVKLLPIENEQEYNGFVFYDYQLSDHQRIFFYVLDPYDEIQNAHIWERVIPKSTFCLIFFNWEDQIENTPLASICEHYVNRFETPVYLVTGNSNEEIDFSNVEDKIIQSHLEQILMYDPDNPHSVKQILSNALNMLLSRKTDSSDEE